MNRKTTAALLTAALLFALLSACSSGSGQGEPESPAASQAISTSPSAVSEGDPAPSENASAPAEEESLQPAPDFTLQDGDGKDVSLSDYKGRVVVLNFWASWCPPCKGEMPDFQKLYENWSAQGDDGPILLAINLADGYRGETVEQAKAFLAEEGYTFPVLFDETGSVAGVYTTGSIPVTHVIDQNGYVYASGVGAVSGEAVQEIVDELLAGGSAQ